MKLIKKTGTVDVVINAFSGQTIDGASSVTLSAANSSLTIISNGSSRWSVV